MFIPLNNGVAQQNRWTRATGARSAITWFGRGCFDSRRRVNSDVTPST